MSGNAEYFRMDRILDIYFVGGFGTVQWVDPQEFMSSQPDKVVLGGNFNLAFLNEKYNNVKDVLGDGEVDDAAFISVDSLGADVRIRRGGDYSVERQPHHRDTKRSRSQNLRPLWLLLGAPIRGNSGIGGWHHGRHR